jgi:single-stranded DNA-binding protein
MKRTAPNIESKVVSIIIEGKLSYEQISRETGVAVSTIKKIRSRNRHIISRAQEVDITQFPIDTLKIIDIQMLDKLERSERDSLELENISEAYRKGELSYRQYANQKRALKVLTVSQLLEVARYAKKRLRVS